MLDKMLNWTSGGWENVSLWRLWGLYRFQ